MKKLQFLALTMLLSTPFAITYTSDSAQQSPALENHSGRQDGRQDERSDKQEIKNDKHNANEDRRQERIDGYKDIKASMQDLCDNDDKVETKKAAMQSKLLDQYDKVSAELAKLPQEGDARLNALDERNMLQEKLSDRKQCLKDRIAMIQSWIDKKQAKIAREQDSLVAKSDELSKLTNARITSGARFENLQSQVADIKTCIADKKAAVAKLQAKHDDAQKSLEKLKDSKALNSESMMASAAKAVSGAAKSAAKSVGFSK